MARKLLRASAAEGMRAVGTGVAMRNDALYAAPNAPEKSAGRISYQGKKTALDVTSPVMCHVMYTKLEGRRWRSCLFSCTMWPFSSSSERAAPPATADVPASNDATEYLRTHSFEKSAPADAATHQEAPTAAGLLRNTALDPAKLHPFANIKDDLEYLDFDEGKPIEGGKTLIHTNNFTDALCYGTGTTYAGGLALGALVGLREGMTRPLGVDSPTFRLRMNAILNQVSRRASLLSNSGGVLAMTYNIFDGTIDYYRGKHDIWGSVAAGALTGAMFRCTAGVRSMLVSSTIMMGVAATWTACKQSFL